MSGLAPLPSVRCRWQLKISSALRRYLVIFNFTASRLSLLGSTVGGGVTICGHQDCTPALCPGLYWWAEIPAPVNCLCLSQPMAPIS